MTKLDKQAALRLCLENNYKMMAEIQKNIENLKKLEKQYNSVIAHIDEPEELEEEFPI